MFMLWTSCVNKNFVFNHTVQVGHITIPVRVYSSPTSSLGLSDLLQLVQQQKREGGSVTKTPTFIDDAKRWTSLPQFGGQGDNNQEFGLKLTTINWSEIALVKKMDRFYEIHPEVKSMTPTEVANWRKEASITIEGTNCPNPILKFSQAPFHALVLSALNNAYPSPTAIQSQGWPVALSGRDMIGSAETGSGKTLAFILPALEHIKAQPGLNHIKREGPIVVVLAPTRELAQQIETEARKYTDPYGVRIACLFGGQGNRSHQSKQLYRCPHLIVATPGRLIDFLEEGSTNLQRVTYLVMDEADRMLDMGFEPQIRKIISQIRPDRQTLMWSATWPRKVQALARDFFNNPIRVNIGSMDLSANPKIGQKFVVCDSHERISHLTQLLVLSPNVKSLIFCSTKHTCEVLGHQLSASLRTVRVTSLHGDKTQLQRNATISDFRLGRVVILVSTDVASRGLDVSDIERVINFDFPANIESYIHRIGRTARAGKKGDSLSYITPADFAIVPEVLDILKKANQPIPEELSSIAKSPIKNYNNNNNNMRNVQSIRYNDNNNRYNDNRFNGNNRYNDNRFNNNRSTRPPPQQKFKRNAKEEEEEEFDFDDDDDDDIETNDLHNKFNKYRVK